MQQKYAYRCFTFKTFSEGDTRTLVTEMRPHSAPTLACCRGPDTSALDVSIFTHPLTPNEWRLCTAVICSYRSLCDDSSDNLRNLRLYKPMSDRTTCHRCPPSVVQMQLRLLYIRWSEKTEERLDCIVR